MLLMGNLLQIPQQKSAKPYGKGIICQQCCMNHEPQFMPLDAYVPQRSSSNHLSEPSSLAPSVHEPSIEQKSFVGMKEQKPLEKETIQMQLPDGGMFVGQTVSGIPEGRGEEKHPSGDHYEGEFHHGLKHGKGCYTFSNEQRYEGDWYQNKMHGYGKLEFINGDWYEGEFRENLRHGKGRYFARQPNEQGLEYFEGQYVDDHKHGMGMMKYTDHQFYGVWEEGKFHHAHNSDPEWLPDQV